jgi:membrane protease YdiL (CAAX protease family)
MLAANISYHNFMKGLGLEIIEPFPEDTSYWWWWAATICVQPAIVEELFFRGCCWRVMTPVMGVHTTVLVSSIMFGFAHIGVPLSIPILTAVGLLLGYSRAWSGSLWLPMILHFVHNLVVILW